MSVVSVSQVGPGRRGKGSDDYNVEYSVPFQVIVNNRYDGVGTVANAIDPDTGVAIPGLWWPYVAYEADYSDNFARRTDVSIEQDGEDWQKWRCDAIFKTNWQIQTTVDPSQDPVLTWIEIEEERRKVTTEWDGTPIKNSAGQLLDGLEADFAVATLCFLRNELAINPVVAQGYGCCVNSDAFQCQSFGNFDPYQLRLKIQVDRPQRRNDFYYYPHTYKMKLNTFTAGNSAANGWQIDPVDLGTAVLGSDGTLMQPADTKTNDPLDPPYLLNGQGKLLNQAAGQPTYYLSDVGAPYGNKQPKLLYQPLPFAALNLSNF